MPACLLGHSDKCSIASTKQLDMLQRHPAEGYAYSINATEVTFLLADCAIAHTGLRLWWLLLCCCCCLLLEACHGIHCRVPVLEIRILAWHLLQLLLLLLCLLLLLALLLLIICSCWHSCWRTRCLPLVARRGAVLAIPRSCCACVSFRCSS